MSRAKRGDPDMVSEANLLDLKNVPCPINFVRTKLKLDTMQPGEILEVLLDNGEPIESVSMSVVEEGHTIVTKVQSSDKTWSLVIKKL